MPEPLTIHQTVREHVELGFTYAEDGAFLSAARVLREAAQMYEERGNEIAAAMEGPGYLTAGLGTARSTPRP